MIVAGKIDEMQAVSAILLAKKVFESRERATP